MGHAVIVLILAWPQRKHGLVQPGPLTPPLEPPKTLLCRVVTAAWRCCVNPPDRGWHRVQLCTSKHCRKMPLVCT
jgi:hypothetical protein